MTPTPHALYRFYDTTEALLYVGITMNPGARWKTHSKDKPWWLEVAEIRVEPFDTREEVLTAERTAITTEHPRYNVIYNTRTTSSSTSTAWGTLGEHMPDDCHDHCAREGHHSTYYPYRWDRGNAFYECANGHTWTCWWGHTRSGGEPKNRRLEQMEQAA